MRPITGRELCRLLEDRGWRLARISGSHHVYSKLGQVRNISVPVHGKETLKPGLTTKIARDAGLTW